MDRCINWEGLTNKWGYGIKIVNGRNMTASRAAYIEKYGKVKRGMDVDHICKNRLCVNLKHLRLTTHRENLLSTNMLVAINSRKTACHKGHAFSGDNLYIKPNGKRQCRTCAKVSRKKYNAKSQEVTR